MAHALYANMPSPATLIGGISTSDTTVHLAEGGGTLFGSAPTGGNYIYATLFHNTQLYSGPTEIVKITAIVGDTLTVIRAQQGTIAQEYFLGDYIEIRVTAAGLQEFAVTADLNAIYATDADMAIAGTFALAEAHAATSKATPVTADEFILRDSVTGLINRLTFGNLYNAIKTTLAALTDTWALSTSGNAATATNVTGYTLGIASGGAAVDIWTNTGNVVQFTGSGTTTGFAAAPAVGAQRRLICSTTGSKFTSGENLIIEGVPSGYTITCDENALVDVLAITTTKFKLRYSTSGIVIVQYTGFSFPLPAIVMFKVENGFATVLLPTGTGTSNATSFTLTGLTASITPASGSSDVILPHCLDSGSAVIGIGTVSTTGVITLYKSLYGGAWTNSGSKGIYNTSITYALY